MRRHDLSETHCGFGLESGMPNSLLWSEKAKYEENPGRDAKESIALRQAHAVLQDLQRLAHLEDPLEPAS